MKFVIGLVCLVVLFGAVYGLGRAHLLPLKAVAKSSPAAHKLLLALKFIAPDAPKPKLIAAGSSAHPAVDPLAAEKRQLAAEQAQIDSEKQQIERKAAAPPPPALPPPVTATASKLVEIYEAMDSDDLATLFAKQPDSAVVSALIAMDTKKAAKALAALPPDRAAKITALMNASMATAPSTAQS